MTGARATGPVVVVGDVVLDRDIDGDADRVCPDAPVPVVTARSAVSRPGGAGLAALLTRQMSDRPVRLVTALGADPPGEELRALLTDAGAEVVDIGSDGVTPEKIRVSARGQRLVRIDRGDHPVAMRDTGAVVAALRDAVGVLVSDYGGALTSDPDVRRALADAARSVPVVWDPHPRGGEPVHGLRLVTPNEPEARAATGGAPGGIAAVVRDAEILRARWRAAAVAVTCGATGAVVVGGGAPLVVPAPATPHGDPCGAGDCFAARALIALTEGAVVTEAVADAVTAASRFVAGGGAGSVEPADARWPGWDGPGHVPGPSARATLVATGGCFDLLHAGHVATLEAARALGERLVVLTNSDRSIERLKGPGRPLQPEADRVAILRSLACVDEVRVFDEDTPERALERLRPDLFVKGGDYSTDEMPETEVLARWGGRTITVPYLSGRSTSRLALEASRHVR